MIIQLPEKLYDFNRLYYSEIGYKVHSGDKNAAPVSREAAGIWLCNDYEKYFSVSFCITAAAFSALPSENGLSSPAVFILSENDPLRASFIKSR